MARRVGGQYDYIDYRVTRLKAACRLLLPSVATDFLTLNVGKGSLAIYRVGQITLVFLFMFNGP